MFEAKGLTRGKKGRRSSSVLTGGMTNVTGLNERTPGSKETEGIWNSTTSNKKGG